MYYPDYGPETSAPDIGDSAVLELVGLGGAAAAGSPAVAGFLGGDHGRRGRHHRADGSRSAPGAAPGSSCRRGTTRGTPLGVDVRRVVELDTTPEVTTGILHVSSGAGQIGAGVATAPAACFHEAVAALART